MGICNYYDYFLVIYNQNIYEEEKNIVNTKNDR